MIGLATSIAFVHHKGGTGKTTSCLSVAGFLAKRGKEVLVIDADSQGSATSGLGISRSDLDSSMYDVMVGGEKLPDILLETESGIYLAPATLDLMGAKPVLYRSEDRINVLKNSLKDLDDSFDYILIDTPPGAGLFLINGVSAADYVIVTFDPGVFSVENVEPLKTIFEDIRNHEGLETNPLMALLTRCSRPSWFSKLLGKTDPVEEVNERIGEMFEQVFAVPYSVKIYESQDRGEPISHYAPNSAVGEKYRKITMEIIRETK